MWINKQAKFDYFIEDRFEAGIKLMGWEVKAIRNGNVRIEDAYVRASDHGLVVTGLDIAPTANSGVEDNQRHRDRIALLHRKEIEKILEAISQKGYTCVVTKLYWAEGKGILKCEVALGKGKNTRDKRDVIKARDLDRAAQAERRGYGA